MNKRKKLTKKRKYNKRTKYTLKHDQELRDDWPEISRREWERLETVKLSKKDSS